MRVGFGTDAAPQPGEPSAQAPFTPPPVAELAKLFPQLQILELVGRGGMGAVYRARQPGLQRQVALKVLPPQATQKPGFAERFTREAQALARLNHPGIIAVHEFGEAGGMAYFVMEFVEGVTLRRLVQQHRLGPREALQIVPQICEALQYAHDEGVVHRDIKPENILIDRKGRVKIADFGIAKLLVDDQVQQPLTQDQVLGTPHYMAPEQIEHPRAVDHRADIYSLGVVFCELLTGELPLGKFAPPSRKVELDVRLDEVVLRALEKEPEHRYQHASEVKTAVETISTATSGDALADSARSGPTQPGHVQLRPKTAATPALLPGWLGCAQWTARILGALILLTFASVVLAEGFPPLARQPGGVQLTSAGGVLVALGFLVGWWREGTAAMLIAGGWALVRASENKLQVTTPFEAVLLVGLLYAVVWWGRQGRRSILATAVTASLVAGLLLGRLLLPTNVRVEGKVADAATGKPIPNAELALVSKLTSPQPRVVIPNARAAADGRFSLYVGWYVQGKRVRVSAPGYRTTETNLGFRAAGQRRIIREYALLPYRNPDSYSGPDEAAARRKALPHVAALPQGRVELVGISYYPATNQPWWRRDGSSCAESFIITQPNLGTMPDKAQVRAIVLRAQGIPPGSSWPSWKIQSAYASADAHVCRSDGQEDPTLRVVLAAFWPLVERTQFKVGVTLAPWQQVAESGPKEAVHTTRLAIPDAEVSFLTGMEEAQESSITIVHNLFDWEIRVLAVAHDRKETGADRTGTRWSKKFCTTTARFAGLRLAEIHRFRLEARPYTWVEFPEVALNPNETDNSAASATGSTPGKAVLTNGVSVAVTAIGRDPRGTTVWWHPDGSPRSHPSIAIGALPEAARSETGREYLFLFRWDLPNVLSAGSWKVHFRPGSPAGALGPEQGQQDQIEDLGTVAYVERSGGFDVVELVRLAHPPDQMECSVQMSFAPWEPVCVYDMDSGKTRGATPDAILRVGKPRYDKVLKGLRYDITHNVNREEHDLRIMARLRDGSSKAMIFHPGHEKGRPASGALLCSGAESDADALKAIIKELILEQSPWVQGTISSIAMKPVAKSEDPK